MSQYIQNLYFKAVSSSNSSLHIAFNKCLFSTNEIFSNFVWKVKSNQAYIQVIYDYDLLYFLSMDGRVGLEMVLSQYTILLAMIVSKLFFSNCTVSICLTSYQTWCPLDYRLTEGKAHF